MSERCLRIANVSTSFAQDPRSQHPKVVEAMGAFEEKLKSASWVIVESNEWEAGFE